MATKYKIWEPEHIDQIEIINSVQNYTNEIYMWLMDDDDSISDAHWIVTIDMYNVVFFEREDALCFQRLINRYSL